MSASAVSICQRALHILGAGTIISLADNNEKARVMNVAYEPVRDAELRRRRWRFSIKRASLAALGSTPDSDYLYEYQMPGDFLRLIEGADILATVDLGDYRGGNSQLYSLEGRVLRTNLPAPLSIRYLARISDVSLFDSAFCEALSARLAYECVERITESHAKEEACLRRYTLAIREAVQANAIENAPEVIADDSWVMARLQ